MYVLLYSSKFSFHSQKYAKKHTEKHTQKVCIHKIIEPNRKKICHCVFILIFWFPFFTIWPLHLFLLVVMTLPASLTPHSQCLLFFFPLLHPALTDFPHTHKLLTSNLFLSSILPVCPLKITPLLFFMNSRPLVSLSLFSAYVPPFT